MLECWSAGVLECWSAGVLECWSAGVLECGTEKEEIILLIIKWSVLCMSLFNVNLLIIIKISLLTK